MEDVSVSQVWKPINNSDSKKLAGPCEVTAGKLTSGGGGAALSLYDAKEGEPLTDNNLRWVFDSSTTDVDAQNFNSPLAFKRGVTAVLEEGAGTNPYFCLAVRNYLAN